MTPSPFARLNTARIRAERRAALRRRVTQALTGIVLAVTALVLVDAILTTALALPETLARAEALKGM